MLIEFALSLGLTLVFEAMAAFVCGLRRRDFLLLVFVNVLTNPMAVLLHALFPGWPVTVALELGVIIVEGLCYARLGRAIRRPWLFSIAANTFSFCMGLGINRLLQVYEGGGVK